MELPSTQELVIGGLVIALLGVILRTSLPSTSASSTASKSKNSKKKNKTKSSSASLIPSTSSSIVGGLPEVSEVPPQQEKEKEKKKKKKPVKERREESTSTSHREDEDTEGFTTASSRKNKKNLPPPIPSSKATFSSSTSDTASDSVSLLSVEPKSLTDRLRPQEEKDDMIDREIVPEVVYERVITIPQEEESSDDTSEGEEEEAGWEKVPAPKSKSAPRLNVTGKSGGSSSTSSLPPKSIPGSAPLSKKQRQNQQKVKERSLVKEEEERLRLERLKNHRSGRGSIEPPPAKGVPRSEKGKGAVSGGMKAVVDSESGRLVWE